MRLFVKICGINDSASAAAAAGAGADAIGFVFAPSPRRISPADATAIASTLPAEVLKVAVFLRPQQEEVDIVLRGFTPHLVQADAGSPISLPSEVGFLPVYREGGTTPEAGRTGLYEGAVSGIGSRADWVMARGVAGRFRMILAGGLDQSNVAAAVAQVAPFGVDVSSGVESAPGVKDPDTIAAFVAAARDAGT